MHIGSIFPISSLLIRIALIPIVPEKNEKTKKFWSFVKSLKKDAFGINSLRENGILKTDISIRLISAIDNLSQLSLANLILKSPQKALAHSSHGLTIKGY